MHLLRALYALCEKKYVSETSFVSISQPHLCKGHTACVGLVLGTQDGLEEQSAFPMGIAPDPAMWRQHVLKIYWVQQLMRFSWHSVLIRCGYFLTQPRISTTFHETLYC